MSHYCSGLFKTQGDMQREKNKRSGRKKLQGGKKKKLKRDEGAPKLVVLMSLQ